MVTIKKKVVCGLKISKVTYDSKRKYFVPKNIHFKLEQALESQAHI